MNLVRFGGFSVISWNNGVIDCKRQNKIIMAEMTAMDIGLFLCAGLFLGCYNSSV
jgi:hypothetical protein